MIRRVETDGIWVCPGCFAYNGAMGCTKVGMEGVNTFNTIRCSDYTTLEDFLLDLQANWNKE